MPQTQVTSTNALMKDSTGQAIASAISLMSNSSIGNMSSLTTTDKTSLVGAINEVNSDKQSKSDNTLTTTAKTVVGGINELNTGKQDKTDNTLETTDKTVVGGINELKSGLINVQADVKLNTQDLTTGSRTKNLLPITVSGIKEKNTTGTWDGDTYTENGISFAIQKDSDGKVTGITANGTASEETYFVFAGNAKLKVLAGNNLILNGSVGGTTETYLIQAVAYNGINSVASRDGDSVAFTPTSAFSQVRILIANGVTVDNVNFYPMIRLASVSDATFVPYIPSVESRIEAVESGLDELSGLKIYRKWAKRLTVPASMTTIVMFGDVTDAVQLYMYNAYTDVLTPIGNSSGITAVKDSATDTVTFSYVHSGQFVAYVI